MEAERRHFLYGRYPRPVASTEEVSDVVKASSGLTKHASGSVD